LFAVAVLAAGCGGATPLTTTDAGVVIVCPAVAPTDGAACNRNGVVCEYGDDPRVQCRTFASCGAARWSTAAGTCDPLPPAACPASRSAAEGQTCAV